MLEIREKASHDSSRGQYRKAAVLLSEGLRVLSARRMLQGRDRAVLRNQLGMAYKYLGEFRGSRRCYVLALRDVRQCFAGSERDFFLAAIYHNLGGLEHSRRRYQVGEKYARKSVELRRQVAEPQSVALASDMAALAALLDGQAKFKESEALYRKVLRIYHREYGASNREIAVILNNLGAVFQATGRTTQAEASYLEALRMKRRELGTSHPDVAITLNNLGMLYKKQHKTIAARECFQKAFRIFSRSLGMSHPSTKAVRRNLRHLSPTRGLST